MDDKVTINTTKKSLTQRMQQNSLNMLKQKEKELMNTPVFVRQEETDPTRLAQGYLAVIRRIGFRQTAFTEYLDSLGKVEADATISPADALREFSKLEKEFNKITPIHGKIESMIKEQSVVVTNYGLEDLDENPLPSETGTYGITKQQVVARDAANFIMLFTTKEANSEVVSEVGQDVALKLGLPWCKMTKERSAASVNKGNNMLERDGIMTRLCLSKCTTLRVSSLVYSHPTMVSYVKEHIAGQAFYDKNRTTEGCLPAKIYQRHVTGFTAKKARTVDAAWKNYQKSVSYRGGQKGKGEISAGYYRFDGPRALLSLMDDVTDYLSVAHSLSLSVIEFLFNPPEEMIRIIINNRTVVVTANGKGMFESGKAPVGHYKTTKAPRLVITSYTPKQPVFKEIVEYSEPPDVSTKSQTKVLFAFDYIRPMDSDSYMTFPSIRAEKGRVIRLSRSKQNFPDSSLLVRFSEAIYTRNWYPFTRVPFSVMDPHRGLFVHWCYPKIEPLEDNDQESGTRVIGDHLPDTCPYIESFLDAVPTISGKKCKKDDVVTQALRKLVEDNGKGILCVLHLAFKHNAMTFIESLSDEMQYVVAAYSNKVVLSTLMQVAQEQELTIIESGVYEGELAQYVDSYEDYFKFPDEGPDIEPETPTNDPPAVSSDDEDLWADGTTVKKRTQNG